MSVFPIIVNSLLIPIIRDSNGCAELRTRTRAQLTINCESDVLCRVGRTSRMNGIVYRPTDEVASKYNIMSTSIAAPIGPNFDKDVMPSVNCCN